MTDKEAILATLEAYATAYCAKDADGLMALFDDGDDISIIGTGADEQCSGRKAIRKVFVGNFGEAAATRFEWHWKHITVIGGQAVVAITLTLHLETADGALKVPLRWTVALVNRIDGWRWLHRNASAAAAAQDKGSAYPGGQDDG